VKKKPRGKETKMNKKLGAEFIGTFWLFWIAPIVGGVLAWIE
jgi:glycerol uptake facilitator-like aquaporin